MLKHILNRMSALWPYARAAARKWPIVLGVMLFTASYGLIIWSHAKVATAFDQYRGRMELQVGDKVTALDGADLRGSPLRVQYDDKRRTLLVAFTAECPFCTNNWPNWRRLFDQARAANVRIVGVDLNGTATPEFLAERGLKESPVFTRLDYRSGMSYKLQAVPTTMLIDVDGRVQHKWEGVLPEKQMRALELGFRSSTNN
jgi:peroxiredoxin